MSNVSPFKATGRKSSGFSADLEPVLAQMHDSVLKVLRAEMGEDRAEMATLRALVKEVANRKVEKPSVTVAPTPAPNVTVKPTINVPQSLAPDVEVEIDLKALLPALEKMTEQLSIANKPVVRTVERDTNGRISRVIESRG